jgi:hypothetical protein
MDASLSVDDSKDCDDCIVACKLLKKVEWPPITTFMEIV